MGRELLRKECIKLKEEYDNYWFPILLKGDDVGNEILTGNTKL